MSKVSVRFTFLWYNRSLLTECFPHSHPNVFLDHLIEIIKGDVVGVDFHQVILPVKEHTREVLGYGLDQARIDGMILEFGVRTGNSINFLAHNTDSVVHGFDSFQGLPEAWVGQEPGAYTTHGELPEVPSNVRLHVGLFDETLPEFLAEPPRPIRFMNVDCDLYSSTKTIFEHLAERVVPGTIIVFDEYLINPTWRDDEYKAFQEFVERYSWKYEYIAFCLFSKQAVVKIL